MKSLVLIYDNYVTGEEETNLTDYSDIPVVNNDNFNLAVIMYRLFEK